LVLNFPTSQPIKIPITENTTAFTINPAKYHCIFEKFIGINLNKITENPQIMRRVVLPKKRQIIIAIKEINANINPINPPLNQDGKFFQPILFSKFIY